MNSAVGVRYFSILLVVLTCSLIAGFLIISQDFTVLETMEYFPIGQKYYQSFTTRPDAYATALVQDFKQGMQPMLIVPFLYLSGGKSIPALILFSASLFFLLLYMVWKIFSEFLNPTKTALAVAFFISIPWMYQSAHWFNSELPLITFVVAGYFLTLRLRRGDSWFYALALGVATGLSLCIRPIETLASLPTMMAILFSVRPFSWRTLTGPALASILAIGFLVFAWDRPEYPQLEAASFAVISILMGLALYFYGRGRNGTLALSVPTSLIIVVAWWDTRVVQIYEWLHDCSVTQTSEAHRVAGDGLRYMYGILKTIGGAHLIFLAAAFLLSVGRGREIRSILKNPLTLVTFVVTSMIVTFGTLSLNDDYRYYVCLGVMIYIPVIGLTLRDDRFPNLKAILLLTAATLSLAVAFDRLTPPYKRERPALDQIFSGDLFAGRGLVQRADYSPQPLIEFIGKTMAPVAASKKATLYMPIAGNRDWYLLTQIQEADMRVKIDGSKWEYQQACEKSGLPEPWINWYWHKLHYKIMQVSETDFALCLFQLDWS